MSFAARGLVDLVPALAVMLGANIGTTLIVQALSFDVSAVAPILFVVGLLAFNFGGRTLTRDLGLLLNFSTSRPGGKSNAGRSDDHEETARAFAEKRAPIFTG